MSGNTSNAGRARKILLRASKQKVRRGLGYGIREYDMYIEGSIGILFPYSLLPEPQNYVKYLPFGLFFSVWAIMLPILGSR